MPLTHTQVTEKQQKRAAIVAEARKLVDAATAAKRKLTKEEQATWDKHIADVNTLADEIKTSAEEESRAKILQGYEDELKTSTGRLVGAENPGAGAGGGDDSKDDVEIEVRSLPGTGRMYDKILYNPMRAAAAGAAGGGIELPRGFTQQQLERIHRRSRAPRRAAFSRYLCNSESGAEFRDLQADNDVQGGFLNSPIQMVQMLLKFVDNAVIIRQNATVWQVPQAVSLGVPTLETDINDADWTAELATGQDDTAMNFGKRELHPKPLAKRIKVSNRLLRTAILGPEAIVRDRMGYKFGIAQEKGFMTGNGVNQPLGLFTASAQGIPTSQDTASKVAGVIGADDLFAVKYALKPQYQAVGMWAFHRTVLSTIMQLKDGVGQYLWRPGLQMGQPDMLIQRPVLQSEYAPNTQTSGNYVGMFADFKFYWIADALELTIQRLIELYAEANQIGFIGRLECDGQPVLAEAFSRYKLS